MASKNRAEENMVHDNETTTETAESINELEGLLQWQDKLLKYMKEDYFKNH